MRINSVGINYSAQNNLKVKHAKKQQLANITQEPSLGSEQPNFKGNAGKIIGGLLGLAAIAVICPAAVAIGLGGIGAGTGALIGAAVDEKLEEEENDKKNPKP